MRHGWWLVASLFFAGCLGAGADDSTGPEDVPRAPLLEYNACEEHLGAVPVPWDDIANGLPDGFSPVPFDDAGAMATGVSINVQCQMAGEVVRDAYIMALVEPPEELENDTVTLQAFLFQAITDNAASMAFYEAMGAPVLTGALTLSGQEAIAGRIGSFRAEAQQMALTLDTVVGQPGTEPAGSAMAFFLDVDGALRAMHVAWTETPNWTGTATLRFTEGGLPIGPGTYAGVGVHNLGEDYTITTTPHPLV